MNKIVSQPFEIVIRIRNLALIVFIALAVVILTLTCFEDERHSMPVYDDETASVAVSDTTCLSADAPNSEMSTALERAVVLERVQDIYQCYIVAFLCAFNSEAVYDSRKERVCQTALCLIIEKYAEWAKAYQEDQVTVVYDTMWNGTKAIAHAIEAEIKKQSPSTVVKVFHIAKSDKNEVMTEVFKSKAIAVGSPTAINDILASVTAWISFAKSLKFKNKKAAAFGCYGWSGEGVAVLQKELKEAGFDVVDENVKSLWNPGEEDFAKVPELVKALLA